MIKGRLKQVSDDLYLSERQTAACFKIQREIAFAAVFVCRLKPVLPH